MPNALNGDKVEAVVLRDVALHLIAIDLILKFPRLPGLENVPVEALDPLLGTIGRHYAIGVT
jgi:hypothetical protein